jgi:hypothetical protein
MERTTPPTTDDEGFGRAPDDIRPIKRTSTLKDGATKKAPHGIDIEEKTDDEYDPDDAEDESDWVKPKFDEIIAKIRSKELDLKTDSKREAFLRVYGDVLNKRTREWRRNILHTIAYEVSNRELVRLIIQRHEYLLEEKDTDGKTPVYIAIMRKRTVTLKHFFSAAKDLDRIDRILAMTDAQRNNCIHAVIQQGINAEMAILLISNAKEGTLRARDSKGRTPLHCAVEYERCNKAQLDIVRELIKRGDTALDEYTNIPDFYSVYEHHEYTRKTAQKAAATLTSMAPPPPRVGTAEKTGMDPKDRNLLAPAEGASQKHEKTLSHDPNITKGSVKDSGRDLGGKAMPERRGSLMNRPGLSGDDVADNNNDVRSEADPPKTPAGVPAKAKKPETEIPEDKVTTATANAIRDEIRLHYLRSTL